MDPAELRRAGEIMRRAYAMWAEIDAENAMPEFDDPSAPFSVELHRDKFFKTASEVAPEFLASLAREPLTEFCRPDNPGSCPAPDPMGHLFGTSSAPLNPIGFSSSDWTLSDRARRALAEWASRWNLTDDWCFVRALFALHRWRRKPSKAGKGLIEARYLDIVRKGLPGLDGIDFEAPNRPDGVRQLGWDLTRETGAAFRKRVASPRNELRAYIHEQWQRAAEHDAKLVRAARKLRPEHFVWLARYQLHSTETFRTIASDCEYISPDPDDRTRAVTDAIHRTAKLIGVTLRPPARGGRPKGAKNRISS